MKKFLLKYWQWLFVLVVGLSVCWPLLAPGYFSHHDDLQVLRVYEMRQCIQDFQLPCRWSKNLGFGNGFPIYNYYGVFPYYVGGFLSFLVGYVMSAKLLFFLAAFGGAAPMWLLSKELLGKYPAMVTTSLYVFAPYRALDIYVRGALAEAWSIALVPLVMYGILKLSRESRQRWFLLATISLFGLLSSHNIMTLFFGPVIFCWMLWCGWQSKSFIRLGLSFGIAAALSSFFLVPAFMEKGLIQNETLTRFDLDFRVHFVTVYQLFFSRFWGYGASVEGPWDGMSFQIGWPHWWLAVSSLGLLVVMLRKKQFNLHSGQIMLLSGLLAVFLAAMFMTHNKSAFIWEAISILQFAQFPWRFLALVIFAASVLGGIVVNLINMKYQLFAAVVIVVITVILNVGYFHPDRFYFDVNDSNKLSGAEWDRQVGSIILDYLPKTAFEPREKAPDKPLITKGDAQIVQYRANSNSFNFVLSAQNNTKAELPIFYFPGWQLWINGVETPIKHDNLLGRISFEVPKGEYKVRGLLGNTMIREVSNLISLVGVGFVLIYLIYARNKHIRF